MYFLDPLQVNNRHYTNSQIDILGNIVLIRLCQSMQTLVKQQVCSFINVFPGREFTGFFVRAQTTIVMFSLFIAVQIVATLAHAGFTVCFEGVCQCSKFIRLRSKVGEVFRFHLYFHFSTLVAVIAITFNDGRLDLFTKKYVFKSQLYGSGTGAGRTGNC